MNMYIRLHFLMLSLNDTLITNSFTRFARIEEDGTCLPLPIQAGTDTDSHRYGLGGFARTEEDEKFCSWFIFYFYVRFVDSSIPRFLNHFYV